MDNTLRRILHLLCSAFYDDRPGLESKFVRVIGIVEEENRTLFCLLWKRDSNIPHAAKATRYTSLQN